MDLSLGLTGTHVLVTGAAGAIGHSTVQAFLSAGALVTAVDIKPNEPSYDLESSKPDDQERVIYLKADISSESEIEAAFETAVRIRKKPVECCVALAGLDLSYLPQHQSLTELSLAQWRRTFQVNVEGTFLTARSWLRGIKAFAGSSEKGSGLGATSEGPEMSAEIRNVSLIVVGSEAATMGVKGNADYSAGKSAVQIGLVQSMVGDASRIWRKARVNAVAPGPVDTPQFRKECQDMPDELWLSSQATTALGKPVPLSSVARTIVFLASEDWSGHIDGQVISVDSGKSGKVQWMPGELS